MFKYIIGTTVGVFAALLLNDYMVAWYVSDQLNHIHL